MAARKREAEAATENAPAPIASERGTERRVKFGYLKVTDLVPYVRNSRIHTPEQVSEIASSIREFGFLVPVLIDKDNGVVAGHGRILAAQKLGIQEVPCVRAEHLTEAQRRAYVLVDNRLTDKSQWDKEMLKLELGDLRELAPEINLGAIGFGECDLAELEIDLGSFGGEGGEGSGSGDDLYTQKIEAPIYTPKGEKPALSELCDRSKAEQLLAEIEASDLPEAEKEFLRAAAQRHTVFNFSKIAEYYAHAPKAVQDLMENSALVIIDFNKAIEKGFVSMTKAIAEVYEDDVFEQ